MNQQANLNQGQSQAGETTALLRISRALEETAPDLDLSRLALKSVPTEIADLTHLENLDLSDNLLGMVPEVVFKLPKLQRLAIATNGITDLSERIRDLSELQQLDLHGNHLNQLPKTFGHLRSLRELDLAKNRFKHFPERGSWPHSLEKLNLCRNQLETLPDTIGTLTNLRELVLARNRLTGLPASIGDLRQLTTLQLMLNPLTTLPESIGLLTQLPVLDLSRTRLSKLPQSIGQLSQLRTLIIRGSDLTELPESIGDLEKLQILVVSGGNISTLPISIGRLSKLELLDISDNELTKLPDSVNSIRSLKSIALHGNPYLALPPEILGEIKRVLVEGDRPDRHMLEINSARPSEILRYYFRVLRGRRPLNEAKLILVGRGAVGKTSLVNRLVHNIFKDESKTEGIRITEWGLRLHDSEDIRLNIWDFGGQEIMHATHQFFLTHRSLYLVVLSGREGGEDVDAEYWLKLIESFGGDSPVIVVLNKTKEHLFDVNRRALRQKYPSVRDFIMTDCLDGTGIDELRRAIELETDRLEHLRDAFPESWFTVKERLSVMEKNYLSFDEYRKTCHELGEDDPSAQESLAGYLHSLGIALNYKDDPRLQDTHVLNPRWVTNGIYKILNSEGLAFRKGIIELNEVSVILDENQYPRGMHRFLFDLMKKFDLCFSFPEAETQYLIPELLDKQEPAEAQVFRPEECLNFQYHYQILPEGLLPRFIVRTHLLSEGQPRWRTGAILQFEGCRALVKADVQDKKVSVLVSGPIANRRRLLAVVRSDLERIHAEIRNLQPEEMVPLPENPDLAVPYQELLVIERQRLIGFPRVMGGQIVNISVDELLNGVDLAGRRSPRRRDYDQSESLNLFISYSHKDEGLRSELSIHLKLLRRQGLIDAWHDRNIEAGDDWKARIDENLESADIVLLLVSADFIASDYCYENEMMRALEREHDGDAKVIPVILRDVSWTKAPFGKLQSLPKDGLAVTKWADRDSAWRNVSEGIEQVVEELRKKIRQKVKL